MVGEHIDARLGRPASWRASPPCAPWRWPWAGLLPILLILAWGSWLLEHGASTGAILGPLTYVAQGVQPALQTLIRGLGNTGLWLFVTLARIVEETEAPADVRAGTPAPTADPRGPPDVVLRRVTFGHGRALEPVICDVDLVIAEGDHLAVAGPSGVGKSTLAGLIAGLLEPQHGAVLVGGAAVAALDARTAARHRVLIPQEAYVFAGTVRENLAYLQPDASDAVIDDVVERLGALALVERLGDLRAELEPRTLSAGERQLLTLVRSYISPARLVILDEATRHLDSQAEARVERVFADREGSLIVIAHRISSALRARRLLLLEGRQALVGSHAELLLRSALYQDLVGHWGAPPPHARAPVLNSSSSRRAERRPASNAPS